MLALNEPLEQPLAPKLAVKVPTTVVSSADVDRDGAGLGEQLEDRRVDALDPDEHVRRLRIALHGDVLDDRIVNLARRAA